MESVQDFVVDGGTFGRLFFTSGEDFDKEVDELFELNEDDEEDDEDEDDEDDEG